MANVPVSELNRLLDQWRAANRFVKSPQIEQCIKDLRGLIYNSVDPEEYY